MSDYSTIRPTIQPLDVVAFRDTASDPIGHPIEVVSELIELAAKGLSHTAIIRQSSVGRADAMAIHCTLDSQGNGVRTEPLGNILAGYPQGSRAWVYHLLPEVRQSVDLFAFYQLCGACDGFVTYDVAALFRFLLPDIIAAQFEPRALKSMVCSVWVATALETAKATRGVTPWRMKPDDVVALPIFQPPVRIL
jgi:hypothetical protein